MSRALIIGALLIAGPLQGDPLELAVDNPERPPWAAAFRTDVTQCWNVQPLIDLGEVPAVTISFEMAQSAHPILDSITLLDSNAVTDEAEDLAFASARRAVVRCAGADGYDLPLEDYDAWHFMELTFAPPQSQLLKRPQTRPTQDQVESQ